MGQHLIWRNGDLNTMLTHIRVTVNATEAEVLQGVQDSVHEGEKIMRNVIEDSVTATGRKRVQTRGKSSRYGSTAPGRIDSGLMVNSTNSSAELESETRVRGFMGWPTPEDYFAYQENGTGRVPAMHALLQGFIAAREVLTIRLTALGRRK